MRHSITPSRTQRLALLLLALNAVAAGGVCLAQSPASDFYMVPTAGLGAGGQDLPVRADGYRGMHRDLHPASLGQLQLLINQLKLVEKNDAQRLDKIVRKQEWHARNEITQLREQRDEVKRIASGGPSTFHPIRKFFITAANYAGEEGVYSSLSQSIDPLEASNFEHTRSAFRVIAADGKIARLPSVLVRSAECREADAAMRSAWAAIFTAYTTGEAAPYETLEAFEVAADAFVLAAQPVLDGSRFSTARRRGVEHAESVAALRSCLFNDDFADQIAFYGRDESLAFSGGTVRDLLSHLFLNRLTVVQGSPAQWELSALADRLAGQIDTRIAQQQEWLEVLKSQHHWHNWVGPWNSPGMERGAGGGIGGQLQTTIGALTSS